MATEVIGTAEYRISANTSELESGIKKAQSIFTDGTSAVVTTAHSTANKVGKISTTATALVASAVNKAFNSVSSAISSSIDGAVNRVDTLNNFPRVMESLGFSSEEASSSINTISDALDGLPTSLDAMISNVQKLSSTMGNLNNGAVNATSVGLALNNMLLAGGKGAQMASNAFEQYNQMLAVGKVDQQAWNSLVNAAPGQIRQMAETLLGASANTQDLYQAMKDGVVTFDDFNNAVVKLNAEGSDSFDSFESQARAATGGIGTAIENVGNRIKKSIGSIIDTIGQSNIADVINSFSSQFGKLGTAVASALADDGDTEALVKEFANSIGTAFREVLPNIGKGIGKVVPVLLDAITQILPDLLTGLLEGLAALVSGLADKIPGFAVTLVDAVLDLIDMVFSPDTFNTVLEAAIKLLGAILEAIPIIVTKLVEALPRIIKTITTLLTDPKTLALILNGAVTMFTATITSIPIIVKSLGDALPDIITSIVNFLTSPDTIGAVLNAAATLFMAIVQAVPTILGSLLDAFGSLVGGLWNGILAMFDTFASNFGAFIGDAFKGALNGVLGFIEGFINTPINLINGFIDVINGAFGAIGVNIGKLGAINLPRMYTGGIVPANGQGTPILAGDGGEDEFVVPESKMASLMRQLQEDGGIGGETFNFTFNGVLGTPSEMRELAIQFHDKYEEVKKSRFQNA